MKQIKLIGCLKIIFVFFLAMFFLPGKSDAQSQSSIKNSFTIIKTGSVTDISVYEKALKVPDIENFRYKTKRNNVVFDNGLTVELFSAQELFIKGESIEPNNYSDTRDEKYIQPIFHLTEKGSLIAMYTKVLK